MTDRTAPPTKPTGPGSQAKRGRPRRGALPGCPPGAPDNPPRSRRPRYNPTRASQPPTDLPGTGLRLYGYAPEAPGCPVMAAAQTSTEAAQSLTRSLRRLRTAMKRCPTCHDKNDCPVQADFNAQLSQALQEVADEWSLR